MPAFNTSPESQLSQVQQSGSAANPFRRNPVPPIHPSSNSTGSSQDRANDPSTSSSLPRRAHLEQQSPSSSSSRLPSHPPSHLASPPRTQGRSESQPSKRPRPRSSVNSAGEGTGTRGPSSLRLPPPHPSRAVAYDGEGEGDRGQSSISVKRRAGRVSLDSGYGGSIFGGGTVQGGGSSVRASSSASPNKRINTLSPSSREVGRMLQDATEEEEDEEVQEDRERTPVASSSREGAQHRREASVASSTSVASSFQFGRRPTQSQNPSTSQLIRPLPIPSSVNKGKKRADPPVGDDDEDDHIRRRALSRTLSVASSRTLFDASSRTVSASPARSRTIGRSESRELDLLGGLDLGSWEEEGRGRSRSNDVEMEVEDEDEDGGIQQQQQMEFDDDHQDDFNDYQPQPSVSPPPPTHRRDKGKGRASDLVQASHTSRSLTISLPRPALAPSNSNSPPNVSASASFQVGGGWDPRFDLDGYGRDLCIYPLTKTWRCVDKQFVALGDFSLPPWEEMDGEWRKVNDVKPLRKRSSTMVYVRLHWEDSEGNEVHGKYLINRSYPIRKMVKHFLRQVHGHDRDRGSQPEPKMAYDGHRLQLDKSINDLPDFECGGDIVAHDQQEGGRKVQI